MQFGFNVPNFGPYADPRLVAELAGEAEAAGWDGFFLWDHIQWPWIDQMADPWIILALIAARTTRIRLGAVVTPLPRRQPWEFARQTTTLDRLSNGRLVVDVGIGGTNEPDNMFDQREFLAFGQHDDARTRAAKLDEGLAVVAGLWSGQPFNFAGEHYTITDTQFLPTPLQQPRPPVWVAGFWPNKGPARRAARWDGYAPVKQGLGPISPDDVRAMRAFFAEQRDPAQPFDLVIGGATAGTDLASDRATVAAYADAGATWWSEGRAPWDSTVEQVRERIRVGPPR